MVFVRVCSSSGGLKFYDGNKSNWTKATYSSRIFSSEIYKILNHLQLHSYEILIYNTLRNNVSSSFKKTGPLLCFSTTTKTTRQYVLKI